MRLLALALLIAQSAWGGFGFVGETFDPRQLGSTVKLYLDPCQWTELASGDAISTARDVSGNANSLTNSGTLRPLFIADSVNSRPVIRFDGSDDRFNSTATGPCAITRNVSAISVMIVSKQTNFAGGAKTRLNVANNTTGARVFISQENGSALNNKTTGGRTLDADTFASLDAATTNATWNIDTAVYNYAKASLTSFSNGAQSNQTSLFQVEGTTSDTQSGFFSLGAGNLNQYFPGDIALVFICQSALTDNDRRRVERFATRRYNIGYTDALAWFSNQRVLVGGRLDAIDYLGNGVVIAGSRAPSGGKLFRSTDYGDSWSTWGTLTNDDIAAIKSAGSGVAYALTGTNSWVFKTEDYGVNWLFKAKVSTNTAKIGFQLSYGLLVTTNGSVLVADTKSLSDAGGHIWRSTDGGTNWTDVGQLGTDGLYRFDNVGDGALVNALSGRVWKSVTDGATWMDMGQVAPSNINLYATEYLGSGVALQGSEAGRIYRSTDNGTNWTDIGAVAGADGFDDFAHLGNGVVVASTYEGSKFIYRSTDSGATWASIGILPTASADVLEHAIRINDGNVNKILGVSNLGFVVTFNNR